MNPAAAPPTDSDAGWTLLSAFPRALLIRSVAVLAAATLPMLLFGRSVTAILIPVLAVMALAAMRWGKIADWAHTLRSRPLALGVVAMFLAWLPSVASSLQPLFSLVIWLQALGMIALIAVLARIIPDDEHAHRRGLIILILGSLLGGAIAALALVAAPALLEWVRPIRVRDHVAAQIVLKSYAALMPCLAPVLLWAGWRLGGAWRWLALGSIIAGLYVVYGTANRAALAGYGGAAMFAAAGYGLAKARGPLRYGLLAALLTAALATAYYILSRLPPVPLQDWSSLRLPSWMIDNHRQVIWSFVLERALERPFFGWGLSMANFTPGANAMVPGIEQNYVPLHSHNWIVQLLCDTGFIGLGAALIVLALFLWSQIRRLAAGDRAALAALALSGAFFVSMLANFSPWQGRWQATLVLLLPFVLARQPMPRPAQ